MIEIPGYTVQRLLGHGGMATVYLAQQKSLGRDVALKVLTPALASDPVATERFLREARVSAKLHHPNIVAIFDVGVHQGVPYMSIAYEPGGTVAGCAQAKNDPKIALKIIRDIAAALDYAHRQGVIHRDVKPENILLRNDGTCVLSDFGIAHAVEAQTGLTREGTSVGTPHYMSPEQLRGEHVDARADIYSLGVVLFQLLTGELPYQGTDGWAIGMQHIGAPIPHLPPHLDHLQTFLDALLAKDPNRRLQSGAEVIQWVDARLSGQGPAMTVAMPSPMTSFNSTPSGARGAASIAILPFVDLSQAKDQEYLADGITEELLNLLSKVPGLFVASRSASMRFKASTAKLSEIGRELKVASVLEGSLRKFGDRIRVSVQMINVADGFQRWSETYDRTLVDVFAIQDEIAGLVVAALKEQLLPNVEAEAAKKAAKAAEEKAAAEAREREAVERAANEEAERQAAEERRQREIHERIMQKKREREEAEQLAAEKKLQEEAERKRREAEEREAAKQREIEERAAAAKRAEQEREDAARREREAVERAEAERLAAERAEVERVAAAKRAEADRLAAEQAEREQQRAREEAQRAEAERRRVEEEKQAAERRQREAAELAVVQQAEREAEARAAAEREAAKRAEAERAAAEREAAKRAEAERAAAEREAAKRAEAERAEAARREAAQREAAEQQRRADEARARAEREATEMQLRADEARVAAERATIIGSTAATAAAASAAAPTPAPTTAEAPTPGAETERDPARDFASAYMSKPAGGSAPPKPAKAPSSLPVAKIGLAAGVLLVLLVGGWLFMQNQQQKNQVACQAALLQGQTDLEAGEFDKAAASALSAHSTCSGASEAILAALDGKIQAGKALAQTCGTGTTQARELMRAGKPKAAAAAMAPLHDQCGAFPGFPELEALPANAQAQAAQLVQQIEPLVRAKDYAGAQALAVQAAAIDVESPGLADLRARLDKQLGTSTPAPAPAPAPTAPVAPPPKPAAPTTDVAAAAAAAKAAADKAAREREAKLAEERARREQQQRAAAAAAAAAASRPAAPAPVPVAPVPAPAPAPSTPASSGRGNALVATSTPQPPYPPQALRGKVSGEVTVSFTVNTDGSVGGVRIVSARPRGTFDRGVVAAVGRWRFQPVDEPQTVTRTITFQP